jgi:hypothetical protein
MNLLATAARVRKLKKLLDPEIRAKNLLEVRYRLRGTYFRLASPEMPDPIFIIGCSRSGTTVTFETLRSASGLLSFPHELPQLWNRLSGPEHNGYESEAAGAADARPRHRDAAFSYFFERLGRGQVLDKTCINVMRVPYLHALFPGARFVYIHRDGRDNISSLIDGWRDRGRFGLRQYGWRLPAPVRIDGGEYDDWAFFLPPGWREYNSAPLEEVCAYQWIVANRLALEGKRLVPAERWVQLRYEDLFDRPVAMFAEVFERLGLPFEDAVRRRCETLNARPTSLVSGPPEQQKWRKRNREAIERVLPKIAPLMHELGYREDG